ncbi:phosphonate metabolism protein/1,5-bisphosphokinase (PRPP-forming) PhnN [uncultured Devosia sp.]|uniref:phosphonate metabolism protein/1,5-bisphosphokinase (PRPP-forming) PhnN n=1 Tax=uncultured Devosia sp. TaxID=211434 RepID=UPI0035CB0340
MSGVFVAIVGPSGAGKDSLIGFARERLSDRPEFVFVRRVVTRPVDRASEDHDSLGVLEFASVEQAGGFALAWDAHGLRYGLPAAIDADIQAGQVVIANVSRQVIAQIEARYARTIVVALSAHPDIIAQRLANRGRETAGAIRQRLDRSVASPLAHAIDIDNSGALVLAGERLVDILLEAAQRQVWPARA